MSSLALLEQMSNYSTEMVDAARANDWDRLTHLENQVASLRDRMGTEEALGFQGRAAKRNCAAPTTTATPTPAPDPHSGRADQAAS